jgi:hypothetical protein
LAWSSAICVCFFGALYLPQDGGGKLFCIDCGCDPLQALLEGALGQQTACQLWFNFEEEIKGRWCEIRQIMELGEHLDVNGIAEKLCTGVSDTDELNLNSEKKIVENLSDRPFQMFLRRGKKDRIKKF